MGGGGGGGFEVSWTKSIIFFFFLLPLGKADIGLFTKIKGTDETFKPVDMVELDKKLQLPKIEPNVSWKRKADLSPWQKASPDIREVCLKKLGHRDKSSRRSDREPLRKKTKQLCADSSSSCSGSSSEESRA